jgi:hypothetical protein
VARLWPVRGAAGGTDHAQLVVALLLFLAVVVVPGTAPPGTAPRSPTLRPAPAPPGTGSTSARLGTLARRPARLATLCNCV